LGEIPNRGVIGQSVDELFVGRTSHIIPQVAAIHEAQAHATRLHAKVWLKAFGTPSTRLPKSRAVSEELSHYKPTTCDLFPALYEAARVVVGRTAIAYCTTD